MRDVMIRSAMVVGILLLLIFLSMPFEVYGQGRGQGRGQDRVRDRNYSGLGRKCEKFVNCHDAREGRLDNRGPNHQRNYRQLSRYRRYRNSDDARYSRRWRNRDRNREYVRNARNYRRGR